MYAELKGMNNGREIEKLCMLSQNQFNGSSCDGFIFGSTFEPIKIWVKFAKSFFLWNFIEDSEIEWGLNF